MSQWIRFGLLLLQAGNITWCAVASAGRTEDEQREIIGGFGE